MDSSTIRTYCDAGTKITVHDPVITTKHIVTFIDELSRSFGGGYVFRPEPISEGGVEMINWPGKIAGAYKTVRFHFQAHGGWPQIDGDGVLEKWRREQAVVIWHNSGAFRGSLFIKAFDGAPCWTKAEINIVLEALRTIGFKCTKPRVRVCDLQQKSV